MMRSFVCIALLLGTLLAAVPASAEPAWAKGQSRGEDLHVYLITFGHGDDIASWFGHTALMVRDDRTKQQRVYNYGMFHFGWDMLLKFLMGRLEFWVDDASVPHTLAVYRAYNRDIEITELNLTPEKRKETAAFLEWNIRKENRDYLYHHYLDNCATRVRDVIDKAVDGQLKEATSDPARFSFRGHTRRHTQRNPYIDILLTTWMNDDIDEPIEEWDEMFLPTELRDQVAKLEYTTPEGNKLPLVKETRVIFEADRDDVPSEPNRPWLGMLVFGLLAGAIAFWAARSYETTGRTKYRLLLGAHHFLMGLLFGIPGLVLVLFHFTEHSITWLNENMLLLSPFTFLALPLSFPIMRGRRWAMRVMRVSWYVMAATSVVLLALKAVPTFDQDNWAVIAMFLPFNLLMAAAMHRFGPVPTRGALAAVAEGIWTVESNRRFLDIRLGSRMTVVQLGDDLWLHSPIPYDEALAREIDALGKVAFIVGPNRYHHMHLGEWAAAYPEAKLYAAPGLEKKRSDLSFTGGVLGDEAPAEWEDHLDQHVFRGADALSEVVFFHRATKTLIVCDTAENFGSSDHLPTRLYLKACGVENKFGLSPIVKATFTNKSAAKESVARVLAWDFERICLCHGSIVDSAAQERFQASYAFLG